MLRPSRPRAGGLRSDASSLAISSAVNLMILVSPTRVRFGHELLFQMVKCAMQSADRPGFQLVNNVRRQYCPQELVECL
jgi:hypothetical protein